jgi:glucose/arabinose dehydrogenase
VSELYGNIKSVANDGHVHDYATNVLNFDPLGPFPGSGEKGLAGLWVETNGNLLATMMYAPNTNDPGTQYSKVTRFYSSVDGESATGSVDLLLIQEVSGASHQISHIEVGPDNLIYVHVGDGTVAANALNTNMFQGKILRMNLNGTPATNNLYYNPANGTNATDYIFAYGVRNPFGGAWRHSGTNYYEVENGPDIDRMVKLTNGASYGWNGSNGSISNNALFRWYPIVAPVNMAIVQAREAYSGFPTQYWNYGFVAESGPTWGTGPFTNTTLKNGKRVRLFQFDASGNIVTNRKFIEYIGTGKGTCVALAAGPDGLYFSDFYKDQEFVDPTARGSQIWRVQWVGTNVAQPVISPAGGTFAGPTNALLTCATPFASLHWTTNGIDPTTNNVFVESGQTVTISTSATLKVKGFRAGYNSSAVTSAVFTITAP